MMRKEVCYVCGREIDENEPCGKCVIEIPTFDNKILRMENKVCNECIKKMKEEKTHD